MIFDPPLEQGILVRRYKRFLADIITAEGKSMTLHCPNTGSMRHCLLDEAAVFFSRSDNPKRKYPCTWEAVQVAHGHWAGINTGRTNALVAEAIEAKKIKSLADAHCHREVTFADSRFDLALGSRGDPHTFIEIKNVTLGPGPDGPDNGLLQFPDAVTVRGQKHLQTLMEVVDVGKRAVLFFCVQHTGAQTVKPADDIDPRYGELLRQAAGKGVEIMAWKVSISPDEFVLNHSLPIILA